jgi:hypothetical protein
MNLKKKSEREEEEETMTIAITDDSIMNVEVCF